MSYYIENYKLYEAKVFPKWPNDGIDLVEDLLIKKDIKFNKIGEKKFNIFTKFNEIFRLEDGISILFKIPIKSKEKTNRFCSNSLITLIVSVASVKENNIEKIKILKNLIDEMDKKYE